MYGIHIINAKHQRSTNIFIIVRQQNSVCRYICVFLTPLFSSKIIVILVESLSIAIAIVAEARPRHVAMHGMFLRLNDWAKHFIQRLGIEINGEKLIEFNELWRWKMHSKNTFVFSICPFWISCLTVSSKLANSSASPVSVNNVRNSSIFVGWKTNTKSINCDSQYQQAQAFENWPI